MPDEAIPQFTTSFLSVGGSPGPWKGNATNGKRSMTASQLSPRTLLPHDDRPTGVRGVGRAGGRALAEATGMARSDATVSERSPRHRSGNGARRARELRRGQGP